MLILAALDMICWPMCFWLQAERWLWSFGIGAVRAVCM